MPSQSWEIAVALLVMRSVVMPISPKKKVGTRSVIRTPNWSFVVTADRYAERWLGTAFEVDRNPMLALTFPHMQSQARVPLSILTSPEQRRALDELARVEDRSRGAIVRLALDEHLARKQLRDRERKEQ